MSWVSAAIAVGGAVYGGIKANKASKDAKPAQAKIKPYQTPKEVFEVLQATQANAQTGFDATTLDYLTNQTDQAFAGSLGVAQRLGSDPNALSAVFGQKINGIMQIGAQNHQLQMQNFSAYLNAQNAVAAGDAAEQKSAQDQLKDQLQKIAIDKQMATAQISNSINTGISAYSNYKIGQLYNTPNANTSVPQTTNSTGYMPSTVNSNSLRTNPNVPIQNLPPQSFQFPQLGINKPI